MHFSETSLPGAFVVDLERREDERGFLARSFCAEEFGRYGLAASFVQCNISFNRRRGTLRGLHFQAEPKGEPKLIRCTQGVIFDVLVDLRPGSSAYCRWVGVELSAESRRAIYAPPGIAHGFVTLVDDSEIFYQMGEFYAPELARGVRWNDPTFGIKWPVTDPILSDRDRTYPDFVP